MSNPVFETQTPGRFIVNGKAWTVGQRYKLHAFVGSGAYGEVCKATDRYMNQVVALKKVPEILCHASVAKRVLREVCIMRRLIHPYIITLTDVFLEPSEEVDGDVDLYIATEFADRGDLYHYRGSMSPDEVKSLMWQFLLGVNYMHSCRVWHRDIKSDNILLTKKLRFKLCDFGLARSAEEELIMRSTHKQTRCPPLFPVCGAPVTPKDGQSYAKDGVSILANQLNFMFDVIGTPCWKDIESVPSESWRNYLKRLSGRAGNLTTDLEGYAEQQAIDLLSRMLEFDPSRRCTSEEALAHAYFKNMKRPTDTRQLISEDPASALSTGALWKIKDPSLVLEQLELQFEAAENEKDGGRSVLIRLLSNEIHQQRLQELINLSFLGSFQAARLQFLDQRKAVATSERKAADSLPLDETKQQTRKRARTNSVV